MLQVQVQSLKGDTLELDMTPQDTGQSIKEAIFRTWSIPQSCQELLAKNEPLQDSTELASVSSGNAALVCLTMVVTIQNVSKFLELPGNKCYGLEQLERLGSKYRNVIVPVVCPLLADSAIRVRRVAAETLAQVAGKGDQEVISSVCALLENDSLLIRQQVASLLSIVAEQGDPYVIDGIHERIWHEKEGVRGSAFKAFIQHAAKLDMISLSKQIITDDPMQDNKIHALNSLEGFAGDGDPSAIAVIAWALESDVKEQAVKLFKLLAGKPSCNFRCAVDEVSGRLVHEDMVVRRHALRAYSFIAGDGEFIVAIRACIERDDDISSKIEALSLLCSRFKTARLDSGGRTCTKKAEDTYGTQALSVASACLEQENESLRTHAVQVLDELAMTGNEAALVTLTNVLAHRSAAVRAEAVTALGKYDENAIAAMSVLQTEPAMGVKAALLRSLHTSRAARMSSVNQAAVNLARSFVADEDWQIRLSALQTLSVLLSRQHLAPLFIDHINDEHPAVREVVLQMLGQVASSGDEKVVSIAIKSADDSDARVRKAALWVLGRIARQGDRQAIDVARARQSDDFAIVRVAAADALKSINTLGFACRVT